MTMPCQYLAAYCQYMAAYCQYYCSILSYCQYITGYQELLTGNSECVGLGMRPFHYICTGSNTVLHVSFFAERQFRSWQKSTLHQPDQTTSQEDHQRYTSSCSQYLANGGGQAVTVWVVGFHPSPQLVVPSRYWVIELVGYACRHFFLYICRADRTILSQILHYTSQGNFCTCYSKSLSLLIHVVLQTTVRPSCDCNMYAGLYFRLMVQQSHEPDCISSLSVLLCCVMSVLHLITMYYILS